VFEQLQQLDEVLRELLALPLQQPFDQSLVVFVDFHDFLLDALLGLVFGEVLLQGVFRLLPGLVQLLLVDGVVCVLDTGQQFLNCVLVHGPDVSLLVFVDLAEVFEFYLERLVAGGEFLQVVGELLVFVLLVAQVLFDLLRGFAHPTFERAQLLALVFAQVVVVVLAAVEHGHVVLDGLLVQTYFAFVHLHLHLQFLDFLFDVHFGLGVDVHLVED